MLRIGLTGGIGSGKTTACDFFAALGVPVIDTDLISRELTQPGQPALQAIVQAFGTDTLNAQGALDRAYLRQRIFADSTLRHKLEAILHPLIKQRIFEHLEHIDAPYVIIAVPLLIESQWTELFDRILVIDAPVEMQIQRSTLRDTKQETQIRAIIQSQTDRQTRCAAADDIIVNNSDLAHLQQQIEQLNQHYLTLAAATA